MDKNKNKPGRGFRLGAFDVFPDRGEIHVDNEARRFEPRVMDVLVLLAERQGEVVSRDTLIEEVWRGAIISDDVISRCIYLLRKQLDDNDHTLIKTVPKRGYQLTGSVEPIAEATETAPATNGDRSIVRPLWSATAVVVVLAIAAFFYASGNRRPADLEPAAVLPYTVAVTPFAEEAVAEPGVLGPGLADDLLYRLSRNADLTVLARSTSFRDTSSVQEALGHENLVLLEGSISVQDDGWLLSVRLIDANTGGELWNTRLATEDLSITEIQRKIELGIVQALSAMPDSMVLPDGGFASDDLEAYRKMLQGREWIHKRQPEYLAGAVRAFEQAAGLDPDYAAAYSSIAEALAHQTIYSGRNWNLIRDSARDAIRRALELDPELAHAHAVNGLVHYVDGDLGLAGPALRKALELNPGFADAYVWLGLVYQAQGRFEDALKVHKVSTVLSPLSGTPQMNIGMAYQMMGRFETAIEHYLKAIKLEPDHGNSYWAAGYAYWRQGILPEALEYFRHAESKQVAGADFFAQFALACFDAGWDADATRYTNRATSLDRTRLWSVRASWASYLRSGDMLALVAYFEKLNDDSPMRYAAQMNLAKAYALHGRWGEASEIYETKYLGLDPWFLYHWDAEWGFSHALMLVAVRQHLGQDFADPLQKLKDFLGAFEDMQAASAGITYLHASIAAVEGDGEAAMQQLIDAHAQGWRRWWWTDIDPSWSQWRGTEDFEALITTLKARPESVTKLATESISEP